MADQTITFTRRPGVAVGPENFTVTIQDGETPNNLENITDDEARAAITRARTAQAGVDLTNYDISSPNDAATPATPNVIAHDSYVALVNESATPPPSSGEASYARNIFYVGPGFSYLWGNGGEPAFGLDAGYLRRFSLTDDGLTTLDFGGGLSWRRIWGNGVPGTLGTSDLETGVLSRSVTDQHMLAPHLRLRVQHMFTPSFAFGGMADLGVAFLLGDDVAHRLSGAGYQTSYCGDGNGSGGIFGNDQGTGGCTNRPLGEHTVRESNDTTSDSSRLAALLRVGPTASWTPSPRFNLSGTAGYEGLYGETSRHGVYVMALATFLLGDVESHPISSAPELAPAPPPAPITDPTARTAGNALTLADQAAVRTLGNLGPNARILGVQIDSQPEDTSAPYELPASAMTAGRHEIKIRYRNPGDTEDRFQTVVINVGPAAAPVVITQTITASGAQFMIQPAATPLALSQGADGLVGTVQSNQAGKKVWVRVDNGAETELNLPAASTAVSITIPRAQLDALSVGAHTVSIRPDGGTSVWNVPLEVRAPVATLTTPTVNAAGTLRGGAPDFSYRVATLTISVNAGSATQAEVRVVNGSGTVMGSARTVSLVSGANPTVEVLAHGAAQTLVTRSTPAWVEIRAQGASTWTRLSQQITLLPPRISTTTTTTTRRRVH